VRVAKLNSIIEASQVAQREAAKAPAATCRTMGQLTLAGGVPASTCAAARIAATVAVPAMPPSSLRNARSLGVRFRYARARVNMDIASPPHLTSSPL
jgi:hypothetical protein